MQNGNACGLKSFPKLHSHPVIGTVVVVPWEKERFSNYVITESFVHWLQSSGARVVLIIPGKPEKHYREIFNVINGLFIPGGADYPMGKQKPVTDIVRLFLKWSMESMDQDGEYFPIWGTCLGLQALLTLDTEEKFGEIVASGIMTEIRMKDKPMEIVMDSFRANFLNGAREKSAMLRSLSDEIFQLASNHAIHPYVHKRAVTVSDFYKQKMDDFYHLLGTRNDDDNQEYVTYIEAKNYPIFATMIHYEKVCFQWGEQWYTVDKSIEAIQVAQAFGNFFVQECCKNSHKFATKEDEWKMLIDNFSPVFVAPKGHILDSVYTFD